MVIAAYRCEICRCSFRTRKEAEECEAQGVVSDPPPRGLILSEEVREGGYKEDGNHLGPNRGDRFCGISTGENGGTISGHYPLRHRWYWFRGNGCGDDDLTFGGRDDVLIGDWRKRTDTYLEAPAVQRAIAACREMGIEPLILRGGQVVKLDEYLREEGEEG